MVLKVVVRPTEEGGFWAEVPALPGCFTQAKSLDQIMVNIREAIDAYLGDEETVAPEGGTIMEIAV